MINHVYLYDVELLDGSVDIICSNNPLDRGYDNNFDHKKFAHIRSAINNINLTFNIEQVRRISEKIFEVPSIVKDDFTKGGPFDQWVHDLVILHHNWFASEWKEKRVQAHV